MAAEKNKLALQVVELLDKAYPEARQELDFSNAFELLVATILAAQCTDVRVNQVTQSLFKKYPCPGSFLDADSAEIEQDIRSIPFFRNKAKGILGCCRILVDEYGGEVPNSVEQLVALPYVGRKTANIVLANAMNIPAIGVDTHTIRVPNRLGLVSGKNPDKIEKALCDLLPEELWNRGNIVIQWHGRYTCKAKKPLCSECAIYDLCQWEEKVEQQ